MRGQPPAEPAVPVLVHTALWDEDAAVRVEAAAALWKIDRKGPLVIPALIEALADDNELICWMAADAERDLLKNPSGQCRPHGVFARS